MSTRMSCRRCDSAFGLPFYGVTAAGRFSHRRLSIPIRESLGPLQAVTRITELQGGAAYKSE